MEKWDACDDALAELEGRICFAGLDLSSTTDISALVLAFPGDDHYDILPLFWVPEEGARRREKRNHAPFVPWI